MQSASPEVWKYECEYAWRAWGLDPACVAESHWGNRDTAKSLLVLLEEFHNPSIGATWGSLGWWTAISRVLVAEVVAHAAAVRDEPLIVLRVLAVLTAMAWGMSVCYVVFDGVITVFGCIRQGARKRAKREFTSMSERLLSMCRWTWDWVICGPLTLPRYMAAIRMRTINGSVVYSALPATTQGEVRVTRESAFPENPFVSVAMSELPGCHLEVLKIVPGLETPMVVGCAVYVDDPTYQNLVPGNRFMVVTANHNLKVALSGADGEIALRCPATGRSTRPFRPQILILIRGRDLVWLAEPIDARGRKIQLGSVLGVKAARVEKLSTAKNVRVYTLPDGSDGSYRSARTQVQVGKDLMTLYHTASTLRGSSGGGLYQDGKLVGIHLGNREEDGVSVNLGMKYLRCPRSLRAYTRESTIHHGDEDDERDVDEERMRRAMDSEEVDHVMMMRVYRDQADEYNTGDGVDEGFIIGVEDNGFVLTRRGHGHDWVEVDLDFFESLVTNQSGRERPVYTGAHFRKENTGQLDVLTERAQALVGAAPGDCIEGGITGESASSGPAPSIAAEPVVQEPHFQGGTPKAPGVLRMRPTQASALIAERLKERQLADAGDRKAIQAVVADLPLVRLQPEAAAPTAPIRPTADCSPLQMTDTASPMPLWAKEMQEVQKQQAATLTLLAALLARPLPQPQLAGLVPSPPALTTTMVSASATSSAKGKKAEKKRKQAEEAVTPPST